MTPPVALPVLPHQKDTERKNNFGRLVGRGPEQTSQIAGRRSRCLFRPARARDLYAALCSEGRLLGAKSRAAFARFFPSRRMIKPGHELFQRCDLGWVYLRAGFQTRKGCGWLVVDAPFAAAFALCAQVLHNGAEELRNQLHSWR